MSTTEDLEGNDLNARRFRMLSDIAKELAGEVVFPINHNVTFRIRDSLRREGSLSQIDKLIALEPLIHNQLLQLASQKCSTKIRCLTTALTVLDKATVYKTATRITSTQLVRSKNMLVFADWTDRLWEQSLDVAAVAGVVTETLTPLDPKLATFAAFCRNLPFYYMLYRATQYPDLIARPDSLKHLVNDWHKGVSDTLFGALDLPPMVIESIRDADATEPVSSTPVTLGEVLRASSVLAKAFFRPSHKDVHSKHSPPAIEPHYLTLKNAARTYRGKLSSAYR